jgi:N-acetylmuramoyl-L-alanine amidase
VAPMKSVRQGQHGAAVGDVQRRLHDLGYECPGFAEECARRFYGEATRRLVSEFQSARGLRATGEVDDATWRDLVEASYRLGDRFLYLRSPYFRGDDVRELQCFLNSLGFHAGREDGIYGPDTDRAVRQFQEDSGLPADGVVGSTTIASLLRLRSVVKPTSVAEVKERLQDSIPLPLRGRRMMLDAGSPEVRRCGLVAELARRLEAEGAVALLSPERDDIPESERASLANREEVEAVLSIILADRESPARAFYFAGKNYVSPRGKRMAGLIMDSLGAWGLKGSCEGRSFPLLRETRMACVVLEMPSAGWETDRVAESLLEAIRSFWGGG